MCQQCTGQLAARSDISWNNLTLERHVSSTKGSLAVKGHSLLISALSLLRLFDGNVELSTAVAHFSLHR